MQQASSAKLEQIKQKVEGLRLFFGYVGLFLICIGFLILVPLIILAFDPQDVQNYMASFLITGLATITVGCLLFFLLIFKRNKGRLRRWQSYILLIFLWLLAIIISAIPLATTDHSLSFSESVFEVTSGLATCGASIMSPEQFDFANQHRILMFYRFWLAFIGGVGLTVIVTSLISDVNGLGLYSLEGHTDNLLPNLVRSARLIFTIWVVYNAIGTVAYILCGMEPFDAVCHSISALASYGLSTKSNSIGGFNSIPVEIVSCVLMLLGGISFLSHFAIARFKFKKVFYHSEIYSFFVMMIFILPLLLAGFISQLGVGEGFRHATFTFISRITTTGYSIDANIVLPSYTYIGILLVMIVGCQAGSTSGGIKQVRLVKAAKCVYWYIRENIDDRRLISSKTIVLYGNKQNADTDDCKNALTYVIVYLAVLFIGSFLYTCHGFSFENSLLDFTNIMSCTGMPLGGIITPESANSILWISTLGMLIGRLEPLIFIMLIAKGLRGAKVKAHTKIVDYQLNKHFNHKKFVLSRD